MKLLEPVKIGNKTARNRIFMPPMEARLNTVHGDVTNEMVDYYAARARGGAGTIVVENTFVDDKESRSSLISSGLYSDHLIRGKGMLAEAIKDEGAIAIIQLSHGGRQANGAANPLQPVAPSAVMCEVTGRMPAALTKDKILEIEDAFAQAARRAKLAGFDGVEIHGAHGYLVSSFFSPHTNRRKDKYGGSIENRGRFAVEVLQKVREQVGDDFIVGIRMNGSEFYEKGGLTEKESPLLAKMFEPYVDYIHVSATTYETGALWNGAAMYVPDGPIVFLAEAVHKAVDVPVVTVGSLDHVSAELALSDGKADIAALGRALIVDPDLPNKLAAGRAEDIRPCCRANEGCFSRFYNGLTMRCELNPACGREREYRLSRAPVRKRIAVVGGGIAGMEAARVADIVGHDVSLYEKTDRLGGHLIEGSAPDFKEKTGLYVKWMERQLEKSGVKVQMNTEIGPENAVKLEADVIIVAVGSDYSVPPIEGIENAIVAKDALLYGIDGDEACVIGGGLVGSETALMLAEQGKTVTIIEMMESLVPDHENNARIGLLDRLDKAGADIMLNSKAVAIDPSGVVLEDGSCVKCDTVVNAAGLVARAELARKLTVAEKTVYVIGDCDKARKIYDATHEAWRAVLEISELL